MKTYVLMQNYPVFIVQCLPHDSNSWGARAASCDQTCTPPELRSAITFLAAIECSHQVSGSI
jgi:hypothetical protein